MSQRAAKGRIAIGQAAQKGLRPLFAAINERMAGIQTALNVPDGWRIERDQMGVPCAFVPPPEKPVAPTKKSVKKPGKKRK